ncbi:FAD binding domain-containing protein [Lasiosphaeria hispida]|uniref:FAD binding domain-containing protein n=1 Tax=Lasiosphaeria hispida TaxID=260671 RepID=A0AAJ0MF87_9PEZI|nr:FAD binding domain-containing protein [Lasiosphaeria hispida]
MIGTIVWLATVVAINASAYQPLVEVREPLSSTAPPKCKCYPGDSCWPSTAGWAALNRTVGGRLIRATPPGAVCYDSFEGVPTKNAIKCAEVALQWTNASWTADQATIPMIPLWSNNTCEPNTATGQPGPPGGCSDACSIGFLSQYAILAKSADDVAAGVNFARTKKLRLIIRNTGHCFMGRSTGYGALVINTHRLSSIKFENKCSLCDDHSGGVVKVGAGVMLKDVYAQAWPKNLDVLGGECPTVGIAGGFVQGGGQGPLSGHYGVGSDHAISFDVVLASGKVVTADAKNNADLFWALKGGGMGTFGVVISVTLKTYPTIPVTGMGLTITDTGDRFWEGVRIWHTMAPTYTAAGMYVWYAMQEGSLIAQPFVAPNMTIQQFNTVVAPLLAKLRAANVTFMTTEVRTFSKFGDLYQNMWFTAFHSSGLGAYFGGRMISQQDVKERGNDIVAAFRKMSDKYPGQVLFGGHLVNPGNRIKDPEQKLSAVHPVWRDTADIQIFLYLPPPCMSAQQRAEAESRVTTELGGILRAVTPKSAVYSNEGDINEPNWQDAFWGPVYPKVLKIKKRYDPNDVFWSKSSTGSEGWALQDNLKLCKVT